LGRQELASFIMCDCEGLLAYNSLKE